MKPKLTKHDTGLFAWVTWKLDLSDGCPGEAREYLRKRLRRPTVEAMLWGVLGNAFRALHAFGCVPDELLHAALKREGDLGAVADGLRALGAAKAEAGLKAGRSCTTSLVPDVRAKVLRGRRPKDAVGNWEMLRDAERVAGRIGDLWRMMRDHGDTSPRPEEVVRHALALGWDACKLYARASDGERHVRTGKRISWGGSKGSAPTTEQARETRKGLLRAMDAAWAREDDRQRERLRSRPGGLRSWKARARRNLGKVHSLSLRAVQNHTRGWEPPEG